MESPLPPVAERKQPWWIWLVIFAPAIFLLVQMAPQLVPVPCLDSWSFVQQYRELMEGRYSWERFFAPNYVHPSAVGKTIYFGVLHYLGGNVAVLPVLSWVFSVIIAFCVCHLARPLWSSGRLYAAVALGCASLVIFTAAQGEVWLWDFVFQNFIPGLCLVVGMWLLSYGRISTWRLVVVAVLGVVSIHSFGTGLFVPLLLCLPIWLGLRGRSVKYKLGLLALWLAGHAVVAWFALTAPGGSGQRVEFAELFDRPLMRLQFILIVLGNILGKGTVVEPETLCAVMGGALLLAFLACCFFVWRRRKDAEVVRTALPWIVFGLYGVVSAGLISLGRMHNSVDNALDERFGTFNVFFVFGTVLLVATVLGQITAQGASWYRAVRRALNPALVLFLAALLINWAHGLNLMQLKHSRMDQERALLTFAKVMSLENNEWMDARVTRKSSFGLSQFLAERERLNGVTFARDRRIDSFKIGKKLGGKWARLDAPVDLMDGRWYLTGLGGFSTSDVADLVLITAQAVNGPEEIVTLAATLMPATFFERRKEVRGNPEHYLGWHRTVHDTMLPKGPVTLRAYLFDQDKRVVHPIEGMYKIRHEVKEAALGAKGEMRGSVRKSL